MFNNIIFEENKPTDSDINKLLIVARKHTNKQKRDEAKVSLFKKCGSVIASKPAKWRALLKYKSVRKDWMYSDEDILAECWIAFQNSINNFGRLNKIMSRRAGEFDDSNIEYDYTRNNFLGYLKKVIDRHLYRVYQKRFLKGETEMFYDGKGRETGLRVLKRMESGEDPSEAMPAVNDYGFTEEEAHIFKSRMEGISLAAYVRMYNISQDSYYRMLESIKMKVAKEIDYVYENN